MPIGQSNWYNILRNAIGQIAGKEIGVFPVNIQDVIFQSPEEILTIEIHPGSAPQEVIADLLSNISIFYRNVGGSGIAFTPEFEESLVVESY